MERHVPELHDRVRAKREAAPVMRCAIMDVVSCYSGVLQQLWIDVSVRCPHTERYIETRRRRKRNGTVRPVDRSSSRRTEDWAAKAPSCCGTW